MTTHTHPNGANEAALADDARALLVATADVAGETIAEARRQLAEALEQTREACGDMRERALAGVKAGDEVVREHPYQTIAIAVGVGAILGYLAGRR